MKNMKNRRAAINRDKKKVYNQYSDFSKDIPNLVKVGTKYQASGNVCLGVAKNAGDWKPWRFGKHSQILHPMTVIQIGKIKGFPVILFGKEYWNNLLKQLQTMEDNKTIDTKDLELFLVTDDIQETMNHIKRYATDKPWLMRKKIPKPLKFLGEKVFFWR